MRIREEQDLKRLIFLNGQALKILKGKQEVLRHQVALIKLRTFLSNQLTEEFNPDLSAQLDAVQFLIDSFRGSVRPDLAGSALTPPGAHQFSVRGS